MIGATLTCRKLGAIEITKPEVVKVASANQASPKEPAAPVKEPAAPVKEPAAPVAGVNPAQPPTQGKETKPEPPNVPVTAEQQQNLAEARVQQAEARAQQAELRAQQAEARAQEAQAREKQAADKAKQDVAALTPPASDTGKGTGGQETELVHTLSEKSWRLVPQVPVMPHTNLVSVLRYSPNGTVVASCSWRQNNGAQVSEITLRDAASGQVLKGMEGRWESAWNGKGPKPAWIGHWGKVNDLVFSPDGATLVSGGEDGRITLWDVRNGTALKSLQPLERPVTALCWASPKAIYGLARDGRVAMWNLTDKSVRMLPLGSSHSGDWVRVGAFSSDGQRLATGDTNGGLSVWNLPGGSLVRKLNNSLYQDQEQPQGVEITAIEFSPDGKLLVSANQAHIYVNAAEKSPDAPEYNTQLLFTGQRVRQIVFAPDGQTAVAVCDSKVLVLNPRGKTAAAACVEELLSEGDPILEIAASPRQDAFVSGGAKGNVVFWK